MKKIVYGVLLILLALHCKKEDPRNLSSGDRVFHFNRNGELRSITSANADAPVGFSAATTFPGFRAARSQGKRHGRNLTWHTTYQDSSGRTLECDQVFSATAKGLRWQVELSSGSDQPFTIPLQTRWQIMDTVGTRFWTAWGDPFQDQPQEKAFTLCKEWQDPLQSRPLGKRFLLYGGHYYLGGGFALPVFTVLQPQNDLGITLVQSPEDTLLDLALETDRDGSFLLSRRDYRLGEHRTIRWSMDLIVHEADWRPALAWMVDRYAAYFNPPNPAAAQVAGCGLYSSYEGPFDEEKYQRMGGLVNWKASFDFPYMGQFIPPLQDRDQRWQRFKIDVKKPDTWTSINQMSRYATAMKQKGFHVLNYFNVTEFGAWIKYPPPAPLPQPIELWHDANAFLYSRLSGAILFGAQQNGKAGNLYGGWGSRSAEQQRHPQPGARTTPHFTWGDALVMDCADSAYADFLFEQARRHIELFPDADGICIDRMDWLGEYNSKRDDGVSWIGERPAASLYFSWQSCLRRLGPLFHDHGKVIFCNPHLNRLELMKEIDGIYNEFGQVGFNLNMSAFMALAKPFLAWTATVEDLRPDPDAYLQHHLYMGAYPTAPFPENDHTIAPDPWAEKQYLDYGPLFSLLKGKQWVLTPHAVSVTDNIAKANMFHTDAGFVIPVIMSRANTVQISCRSLNGKRIKECFACFPGTAERSAITPVAGENAITLSVPVQRRCALVVIRTE